MDYRILGPLEAFDGERRLSLGGARQRAVLALMILHENEVVSRDVIVDALWGEEPPATAAKVLQNCVSALRKERPGGTETLLTRGAGYELRIAPGELDRDRFERLLAEGRAALAAGDHADAGEQLRKAVALWRGAPLSDFTYERFAQEEITRLEELHVAALEDRIEADLALGRHVELVPELEALVAKHPLRERLRWQLMLALYRTGRQAESLETYRAARRTLLAELGIEPGRALHELERAILEHDPALDAPVPARAATTAASGTRPGRMASSPILGRDEELALLRAGLDDALAGRGRLFLVVGEAGSGKTRFADEVASLAKQRGARILWGRGWAGGGAPAYWPWRQAMRDAGHPLPEPAAGDETARFQFFEAVSEAVRAEASEQPLLLVFDDLDSADDGTLLLLEFVASELPEMGALVLALGRGDASRLDDLARHATRTVRLAPHGGP
ncbi:MAG TPA: BTAD domain-containing putative transcriptional regulator [Gaiellaceae bacterium]